MAVLLDCWIFGFLVEILLDLVVPDYWIVVIAHRASVAAFSGRHSVRSAREIAFDHIMCFVSELLAVLLLVGRKSFARNF